VNYRLIEYQEPTEISEFQAEAISSFWTWENLNDNLLKYLKNLEELTKQNQEYWDELFKRYTC
jgi:hypothetical protein